MMNKKFATVCVLVFFAATLLAMPFVWMNQKNGESEENVQYTNIDWQSLYPYEEGEAVSQENAKETVVSKVLNLYQQISSRIKNKLETQIPELVLYRQIAIEGYGFWNNLIKLGIVKDANNTTIRLQNGYLIEMEEKRDTETSSNNLIEFSAWVKKHQKDFLYVMCPTKLPGEEDLIPGIIEDVESNDKDKIAETVSDHGVDILDLRKNMPEDYNQYMDMFYKTDHHWKTETGLWAASLLAQRLNSEYGFDFDLERFSANQYSVRNYPNLFLGTLGKKVSEFYSGLEDFNLLIPKYQCEIHIEIPSLGMYKDGDFMAMIDEDKLVYGNEYKVSPYSALMYLDRPLIRIQSSNCKCNKKILMIKDSYADAVTPYIAANCAYVDIIDLRHFNGSIKNFLSKNNYDIVIVMMRSSGMIQDNIDSTENKLWTYR